MKTRFLALSLLLVICTNLRAAPSYVYWQDFGDVPIDIDGVPQKITHPLTICKPSSATDTRNLSLKLQLSPGTNAMWEVDNTEFNPAGADCQQFNITMIPTGTGKATGSLQIADCVLDAAPCSRTLNLEADIITSETYEQQVATGVYRVGRLMAIGADDNRLATGQPVFLNGGNKFFLIGSEVALDFTVDNQRNFIFAREGIRFPGAAGSLFCEGDMNLIHEFVPPARRLQLRGTTGHILGWSQKGLLSDGDLCRSFDGLVQVVPNTCPDVFCAGSGRLEVRNSPNGTYGTVCDNSWDLTNTHVVCRQLGYTVGGIWLYEGCTDGTGPINLDNTNCAGNEESLLDCPASPFGDHNCRHNKDVHLACAGSGFTSVFTALIGCPDPGASGIQYLGCDQSETAYSINTLTSDALNILNNGLGGGSLPIAFESLTSPGGDIVGQVMLETDLILLTRDAQPASVMRKDMSAFTESQTINQISGKSVVAKTGSRLYAIDRETSRPQLHHYPFANSAIDTAGHRSHRLAGNRTVQTIKGAANGIVAVGYVDDDGDGVAVEIFMEVDDEHPLPHLQPPQHLHSPQQGRAITPYLHQGSLAVGIMALMVNLMR